jgi:FkbM family methyltransferase
MEKLVNFPSLGHTMPQFRNTLKQLISTPIAKIVIALCCASPSLRHYLGRVGITPGRFGKRVVRVPLRDRPGSLLIAGAGDVHLSFQLFWVGIDYYEPFTRTVVEMLAARAEVFIDVGANIGFFSLVAGVLNPRLKVVAFEPNPKMFALLLEHKRVNGLSSLTAEPLAVSNSDGTGQLFLSNSDMSASLQPDFQADFNPAFGSVPVQRTTLDSYVRRHGISGPLLLKVDVEGHDKAFLEGAWTTIAELRPDIVLEVLGDFETSALERFKRRGYSFYRITHEGLIESKTVTLTRIGDFVFYNYLFTTKSTGELQEISRTIRERARHIDLYRTSKFPDHPV